MFRWHLYPLLCSSVPPTARCHQQLLLRNCTEHWQRASYCLVFYLYPPHLLQISTSPSYCVPSVVVSNGGEWHWNKNKDVVMLPSCREVWSWSPKGVKKKFRRTQYSEKASNSKHNISILNWCSWNWLHSEECRVPQNIVELTPLYAHRGLFVCWYIVNVGIVDRDRSSREQREHQTAAQLQSLSS